VVQHEKDVDTAWERWKIIGGPLRPKKTCGSLRRAVFNSGPRERFHDKPYIAGDADFRGARSFIHGYPEGRQRVETSTVCTESMAGAPLGNQNAAKAKQWSAAIERALERRGEPSINPDQPVARTPRMKALDELADKFVTAAMAGPSYEKGDPWLGVVKEFGDRMDGRPSQPIEGPDGESIFGPLVAGASALKDKLKA
jgi:hypothetical protein